MHLIIFYSRIFSIMCTDLTNITAVGLWLLPIPPSYTRQAFIHWIKYSFKNKKPRSARWMQTGVVIQVYSPSFSPPCCHALHKITTCCERIAFQPGDNKTTFMFYFSDASASTNKPGQHDSQTWMFAFMHACCYLGQGFTVLSPSWTL